MKSPIIVIYMIYIGCVDGGWAFEWLDFYMINIYDYYNYDRVSSLELQQYQQYYEDYIYVLEEGNYGSNAKVIAGCEDVLKCSELIVGENCIVCILPDRDADRRVKIIDR